MATVTVCVPTYNRHRYLREALDSVLAQSFADFEVLISDNGSDDGTREVGMEYERADRRIIYQRLPVNRGFSYNFTRVLSSPTTEFVAYLPDDDLWCPHHLQSAVHAFRTNPHAVLYGCTAAFFDNPVVNGVHRPYWATGERQQLDTSRQFAPFLKETPVAPVSVVFRSSAREDVDWFQDDSFGAVDWLVWGQIALCGSVIFDSAVGARLRWHQGNLSHSLLKGRRSNVQFRYVIRHLATLALERGALTPKDLVREVLESWPVGSAANLVVALASIDSHPALREAALEVFQRKPGLGTSPESTKHCRMASRVGDWYLGFSDVIDRALGRWWHPVKSSGSTTH